MGVPPGRVRPAVREIPGANEEAQGPRSLGTHAARAILDAVLFRRRPRFSEVIARQLDLFEEEHAELIRDTDAALAAYNGATKDEAEERFGDYRDLVAEGEEALAGLRDAYAGTLDEETADAYREEFDREVRRRLPRFGLDLV